MSNQLFENAVKACKSAMSLSNETDALTKHLETLQGETASAVEIACAESYAWFISVNRKHGGKQDLATASGVSGKTIGRWIASGHVALVTEGKVTASEVNSAIGNYSMKIAEVEKVQTLTEWRNLLKAYKAVNKSGAGKVVGKAETTEETEKVTAKGKVPLEKSGGIFFVFETDSTVRMFLACCCVAGLLVYCCIAGLRLDLRIA